MHCTQKINKKFHIKNILAKLHPRISKSYHSFFSVDSKYKLLMVENIGYEYVDIEQLTWIILKLSDGLLNKSQYIDNCISHISIKNFKNNINTLLPLKIGNSGNIMGVFPISKENKFYKGAIHQANGGVLLLPAKILIDNLDITKYFFYNLYSQTENWDYFYNKLLQVGKVIPRNPSIKLDLKVILIGSSEEFFKLYEIMPYGFESFVLKTQIESSIKIDKDPLIMEYWNRYFLSYVKYKFDNIEISKLLEIEKKILSNLTNSRFTLPLNLNNAINIISRIIDDLGIINPNVLDSYLRTINFEQNLQKELMLDEIKDGFIHLGLKGQKIGQVIGLAVAKPFNSHVSFGLPFKVTCVSYYGDGELLDIDNKVGLGGAIHQKSVSILQAFLRFSINYEGNLPLSSSIVSEQTYDEFDGDSASIAELCCWVSSLSLIPFKQNLAVTGSINQFGDVQVVGGVYEKILGFWEYCKYLNFPDGCGIILPKLNADEVLLPGKVIETIYNGKFKIYGITKANQAISILSGMRAEIIYSNLLNRLKNCSQDKDRLETQKLSLFRKIQNFFVKK